jgi:hypothetical protein
MKILFFAFWLVIFAGLENQHAFAVEKKVTIVEPANKAKVINPVKVCMEVEGLVVEPAENGVNEGKGHHHIFFHSLPVDLSKPIGENVFHLGDASTCRTYFLNLGKHVITTLFADGDHVPYSPAISDKIIITVKKPW